MDIQQLKNHLIANIDYIEELLESKFHNIKYYDNSKQWRFGFLEDDNPNSIRLSATDLSYKNYKYNEEGDIFTLFMKRLNINLGKCLQMFSLKTCFESCEVVKKEVYGGFFKQIKRHTCENLTYYTSDEIEKFPECVSKFFLEEGITVEAQQKFNIRIDVESNRIVIPVYLRSKLVGAIGRYNTKVTGNTPKYLPTLPYHKTKVLFGYDVNYANMYNNTIYLVESEKTVIKAYGLGYKNLLAIGGNNITQFHKDILFSLNPKEIIVILDKGLGKERAKEIGIDEYSYMKNVIENEAKKLISKNVFIHPQISYINMNDFEEVDDCENIFEVENFDLSKCLDKKIIL